MSTIMDSINRIAGDISFRLYVRSDFGRNCNCHYLVDKEYIKQEIIKQILLDIPKEPAPLTSKDGEWFDYHYELTKYMETIYNKEI